MGESKGGSKANHSERTYIIPKYDTSGRGSRRRKATRERLDQLTATSHCTRHCFLTAHGWLIIIEGLMST